MKRILLIIFFLNVYSNVLSAVKENIINNLSKTKNLSFDFEQNINGAVETGNCIIEYPKKIFCTYNRVDNKILISDGKSLVIKNKSGSYYKYAIKKTPLNYILDKDFLVNEIKKQKERIIDNKFINFKILKNENEINIFFDKDTYNLIGWQTLDIYQNLNITHISSLKKNQILEKNIFKIPLSN